MPNRTRNYIAKDWFRDLGRDGAPSGVAARAADALREYLAEPGVAEPEKTVLLNSEVVV
jgi:cystathionine beta-synthase